jgi:hypothetical protein
MIPQIKIKFLDQQFVIAKLKQLSADMMNALINEKALFFIGHTHDELSIICEERFIHDEIVSEPHWSALKVEGQLPFTCIGILNSLLTPLADAKISILAMSTFDTDYVFFKAEKMNDVKDALSKYCDFC